jgi:predicted RNA-binding Zn-ribbon protein involved in translation (DUF1610 family)
LRARSEGSPKGTASVAPALPAWACPHCGGEWNWRGGRARTLKYYQGPRRVWQRRCSCRACGKSITLRHRDAVGRRRYAKAVIAGVLTSRNKRATWEEAAGQATAAGDLDVSVAKRWGKRLELVDGEPVERIRTCAPGLPLTSEERGAMLAEPAGSRRSNLPPGVHWRWQRGPPP